MVQDGKFQAGRFKVGALKWVNIESMPKYLVEVRSFQTVVNFLAGRSFLVNVMRLVQSI